MVQRVEVSVTEERCHAVIAVGQVTEVADRPGVSRHIVHKRITRYHSGRSVDGLDLFRRSCQSYLVSRA